jgi:hypothetical protein
MAALSLIEAMKVALNRGETKRAGVIATFARASSLMARLPFKNIPGNSYAYDQEGTLPGVAFRGINEAYTQSVGIINPAAENLKIAGGDLGVDVALIKMLGDGTRATQESLKTKALAASITQAMFKGDTSTDSRSIDGFQARVNVTGPQLIENGSSDGGDVLSMFKLDTMIQRVAGPNKVIFAPVATILRITQAARTTSVGGYVQFTPDEFGRQIASYNGIPLLPVYPENDGVDPLDFTELGSTGATASASSIYCASLADGYVSGIQNGVMEVRDLGEQGLTPQVITRVEWLVGLVVEHPRAIARLRGVKTGAAVA